MHHEAKTAQATVLKIILDFFLREQCLVKTEEYFKEVINQIKCLLSGLCIWECCQIAISEIESLYIRRACSSDTQMTHGF